MQRNKLDKILYELRQSGILAEDRDIKYGVNRIRFHNIHESEEHLLTKALLGFEIFKKGDGMISEADLRTGECPDVMQLKPSGETIYYEIMKDRIEPQKSYPCFVIYLTDMPKEVKDSIQVFTKWVKDFIA